MSETQQVNTIQTLGYVVLLVYVVVATVMFGPLIVKKIREAKVRRQDSKIFKAAEEARNDFN